MEGLLLIRKHMSRYIERLDLSVAQTFVRAGHVVYGLTRSQAKAKQLSAEESKPHPPPSLLHATNPCAKVIPVIGELNNPEPWLQLIPTLDIIGGSADIRSLKLSSKPPQMPPSPLVLHMLQS